jgi:predicted N-formylglutamate amidohydrolase
MIEACRVIGDPVLGGILIVSDHASARVPDDIDLGIDPVLLRQHVAIDIGVAGIAEALCTRPGFAAFLGDVSRLVCDFNRPEEGPFIAPATSDGHPIPGNLLDETGYEERLDRFYRPYHAALEELIARMEPALIVSLHSFTPHLASRPHERRPWHCGILYNRDARGADIALDLLRREEGLVVGDQEPYSGEELNTTMDDHAEAQGRLYFGIEIRQDLIGTAAGQQEWADRLDPIARAIATVLR